MVPIIQLHYQHEQGYGRDIESALFQMDLADEVPGDTVDEHLKFCKATRAAVDSLHHFDRDGIIEDLKSRPETRAFAATLISQSDASASKWLTSPDSCSGIGPKLDGKFFIEALRQRCLIPYAASTNAERLFCPCRQGRNAIDLAVQPFHWDVCHYSQGLKTDRHNHMVSHTARLLRSVGFAAEIEPTRHGTLVFEEHGIKRPDIAYSSGGITKYLDVVVASPASATAMSGGNNSLQVVGGAALQAEARKRHDYRNLPVGIMLMPFALESSGRFGPSATNILNFVCADHPAQLKFYIRDVSICMAANTGRIINFSRGRVAAHPHG
jgi:hypothetical protein